MTTATFQHLLGLCEVLQRDNATPQGEIAKLQGEISRLQGRLKDEGGKKRVFILFVVLIVFVFFGYTFTSQRIAQE